MTLSKAANKTIDLARKVREYYTTELPKRHPNYPLISVDDEQVAPPPDERELRKFLASLSDEMIYQLMLLMYLGRGDFGTDDLAESYEGLKGMFEDPKFAASQMLEKAPLADYLSDGLDELRKHKINVDKMCLTKVKVRK